MKQIMENRKTTDSENAWEKIRQFEQIRPNTKISPQAKKNAVNDAKQIVDSIEESCRQPGVRNRGFKQCMRGSQETLNVVSRQKNYPIWVKTRMKASEGIIQNRIQERYES